LLTPATVLNVLDQQTLSIMASRLSELLHLSRQAYANVVTAHLLSFTVIYAVTGRFVDWAGERVVMSVCNLWRPVRTMLAAFVQGPWSLGVVIVP
jgi:ACS family hexuronate transporter-like MFS transporter